LNSRAFEREGFSRPLAARGQAALKSPNVPPADWPRRATGDGRTYVEDADICVYSSWTDRGKLPRAKDFIDAGSAWI